MYEIHFGYGPTKRVFLPAGKKLDGMITTLPTSNEDNEFELYIRLDKRFVDELLKTFS